MTSNLSPHFKAVFQALVVTFLWSTSWVLIKIGLRDIPALTFAGLRYSLAWLCLLPFALQPSQRQGLRLLRRKDWISLAWLGLLFYTLTPGAQFVGLAYLPAVTVSLLLNFTSLFVALLGIFLLSERPSWLQWSGMGFFLAGILIYFYPVNLPAGQALGFEVVMAGVIANALSAVLGRGINRTGHIPPLLVTTVSMGIGSLALLASGIMIQGLPHLSLLNWLIIAWLAVINTAFAFTLWNHTLRVLSAMESSIINSTMLVQIALLAWLFLGESLNWQKGTGMLLAGLGALVVQLQLKSRVERQSPAQESELV
jgi:drug/metabolite transporter (DMT)-like permease